MAHKRLSAAVQADHAQPDIRTIHAADLTDALRKGYEDFMAKPSHLLMLALIYPIVGFVLAEFTFGYNILPLLFPMIAGFALIGPMAALGLYEMSRRRELGLDMSWRHAFEVFGSHSIGSILTLGVLQLIIYLVWLGAALTIYSMIFGATVPESFPQFAYDVLTTAAGWELIIVGCGVGFLFALVVLIISAISFPLLLDRDYPAEDAIQVSIRAFAENPGTMILWGFIVSALLVIGMIPLFVGLAIVMPVLGHATWHLYRKVVQF